MFLKNYTSNVPVSETVLRIEKVLIRCGAASVNKEYVGTKGVIAALSFEIETPSGKVPVRLPVDVSRALDALWLNYSDGEKVSIDGNSVHWNSRKKKKRSDFVEQAKRTAWKIVQDWTEVQMSMIALKQADVLQVFLPYVITSGGESVYQRMLGGGFKALLPETAPTSAD